MIEQGLKKQHKIQIKFNLTFVTYLTNQKLNYALYKSYLLILSKTQELNKLKNLQ